MVLALAALAAPLAPSAASAQTCPADRRCYYVPPQMPAPENRAITWDLVIATSIGTVAGTYRFGSGAPTDFTATVQMPAIIPISATNGVASAFHLVETRGIFIEAEADVFIAARANTGLFQSSSSIKEASYALGTRFRAGGYALNLTNSGIAGHDTLSVYAPTGASVTFTAPRGITGNFWRDVTGPTHTVSLAAGETFIIRTLGNACNLEIDGALVTATAPIAVLSGGRGWGGGCGVASGCGDDGVDNVLPTSQWGNIFTVANYPSPDNQGEDVRVVADIDDTQVLVNGVMVATLMAGQTHTFIPTAGTPTSPLGTTLIETSNPVGVYHNAGESSCELGLSFVPPTDFRRSVSLNVAVNVVGAGTGVATIETPRVSSLRLDGMPLASPTTALVPGRPDITMVRFAVPSGTHVISAMSDFQLGLVTAAGGTGLFAFFNPFRVPGCGNGQIDGAEGCDDGGVVSGDGCSANCRIEVGGMGCVADAQCVAGGHCDAMGVCQECVTDVHCNDANDCSTDTCVANRCVNTSVMLGTACPGGVCNGAAMTPQCLDCIDTAPGTGQDLGCTAVARQCTSNGMGGFQCVGCTASADCDDGNACTANACSPAGNCSNPPVMAGTACATGVCNGNASTPDCVPCVDNAAGGMIDSGCSAATPLCDRSQTTPVCVACIVTSDCATSGNICVEGTCDTPRITLSGPSGTISTLSTTPTGTATHLPDGALLSVTVTEEMGSGMFMCTAFVMGGTWSCAADSITGLTPGTDYSIDVEGSIDGVMLSASGSFSVGSCAGASAGDMCSEGGSSGTCQGTGTLSCCQGCWDGTTCLAGNTALVCGRAGVACAACTDGNECTNDVCDAGTCTNPAVMALTACTGGVCNAAAVCSALAVSINAPADGALLNDDMPTLSGTVTPGTTVALTVDGASVGTAMVDASGNWSFRLASPLLDGPHDVVAVITVSGMTATDESAFTVDTVTTVAISMPDDGSTTLDSTPLLGGMGERGATVVVSIDGTVVGTVMVDASGTWTLIPPTPLANGDYDLRAVATDEAGNMATDTSTFTVDSNTDIGITAPANGSVTNDNTPRITGTARPGASVEVVIDVDGTEVNLGTVVTDSSGNWTVDLTTALADDTYVVTATATDTAGNMAADSVSFTVDTETSVSIATVDPITGVISGTGEPGATVVVTVDGREVGTAVVDDNGNWTLTADPLLAGERTVVANATDSAGNTATDSMVVTVPATAAGGGLSGGALCATRAPAGDAWPAAGSLLLVGLALATRRRRR